MRRLGVIVGVFVVAVLALVLVFFALGEPPVSTAGRQHDRVEQRVTTPSTGEAEARRRAAGVVEAEAAKVAEPEAAEPDEERARALRARILAAQRAREAEQLRRLAAPEADTEAEPEPGSGGGLTKRMEGHEALHAELNRDFMPLADECIEQAQGRAPELAGMLAVGFEIVVDEELGAVVEAVEFPEGKNEVVEPELLDCIDASLISMLLPPGAESGREALMLTIPVEPPEPPSP